MPCAHCVSRWAPRGRVCYAGEYFAFDDVLVDPSGTRKPPPLWIGGGTRRSLDRALALGDGWMPSFSLPIDRVTQMLASCKRPPGFTVTLPLLPPLDPIRDPSGARRALNEQAELGADVTIVGVVHTSLREYLEQLDALSRLTGLKTPKQSP